ncbi:MAG: HD-GYP domain-containing protein [Burkholderiales bacterium]|nr:HD-GYP domain-containing protein [Burkholderiales bacterium]
MQKSIPVQALRPGMFVERLPGSWIDHPFWRSRFVLESEEDRQTIIQTGIAEVWIDTSKGLDVDEPAPAAEDQELAPAPAVAQPDPEGQPAPVRRVAMADEVDRARSICKDASKSVVSMFQEARLGRAIAVEEAGELVDEISASVERNPGALISLARLKTADDYTYMHSVAVCALMVALSRTLRLDEAATREAGMAGLLHDLGKALVPLEVLNKPGKLTDEEFAQVKAHPEHGHHMLAEGGGAGPGTLDVCLHHHERIDGRGYPHGLSGTDFTQLARMGAICDVYDAITSNRPYKAGWDPGESIRRMSGWCKDHLDEPVFHAFVKSIGIYPVGSLVRLSSQRLAVVVEMGAHSLLTPKVRVVLSVRSRERVAPELIDLAAKSVNEKIVGVENPQDWKLTGLEKLWAG